MRNKFSLRPFVKPACLVGIFALLLILQGCSQAEEEPLETLPMQRMALENMEAFQAVADNWRLAGDIEVNRQVVHDLHGREGTGILVNIPTDNNNEHLFTTWSHGDLELEFDFLMPKGSNSGIYLMGRYEIQLFDSWGVENPRFSDLGGIYERWDESRPEEGKGFEGYAPGMNAARAPGLWQHGKILFKAPEFNQAGEKIANAAFEEVWLNGVLVHEDTEVTGPTRAAPFDDEQPEGPLMIQGDHGPVAVRNISFKKYDKNGISLDDLRFEYVAGEYEQFPDFDSIENSESGTADSLAGNIVSRDDRYALRYNGMLDAPNSGMYLFKLQNAGSVRMRINGNIIFEQDRPYRMHELVTETVELESGQHEFSLEYLNHPNNWYRGLALFTEGPQLRLQKLHASSSVPGGGRKLPDLIVGAEDRVKIIRSFAEHRGSKRTHVVNVGSPNGINFSYDMGQATLLHAWEGPYINANEMWINRGDPQTASPGGPPITFDGKPLLAKLNGSSAVWPDSISWEQLIIRGYAISDSGWPVFRYTLDGVDIEDRIEGYTGDRRLLRTITFRAPDTREDMWFQLASGKQITMNALNEYVVDDRAYYLKLADAGSNEHRIVQAEDRYDLRIPILTNGTEAVYKYEIIW